jgi:DNA-binding NarL/FixJ family response regulator
MERAGMQGNSYGESRSEAAAAFAELSAREIEVLLLVAQGASNAAIAATLGVSARTVQSHVAAAMRKSRSQSRTHMAVRALRGGVAPLD